MNPAPTRVKINNPDASSSPLPSHSSHKTCKSYRSYKITASTPPARRALLRSPARSFCWRVCGGRAGGAFSPARVVRLMAEQARVWRRPPVPGLVRRESPLPVPATERVSRQLWPSISILKIWKMGASGAFFRQVQAFLQQPAPQIRAVRGLQFQRQQALQEQRARKLLFHRQPVQRLWARVQSLLAIPAPK